MTLATVSLVRSLLNQIRRLRMLRLGIYLFLPFVLLTGCSLSGTPHHEPLQNTYWKLVELLGEPVEVVDNQREAYIQFTYDGLVKGHTGCNQFFGQYHQQDSILSFSRIGSTRMACLHNKTDQTEQRILELLKTPRIWIIQGENMIFFDNKTGTAAKFKAVYF